MNRMPMRNEVTSETQVVVVVVLAAQWYFAKGNWRRRKAETTLEVEWWWDAFAVKAWSTLTELQKSKREKQWRELTNRQACKQGDVPPVRRPGTVNALTALCYYSFAVASLPVLLEGRKRERTDQRPQNMARKPEGTPCSCVTHSLP